MPFKRSPGDPSPGRLSTHANGKQWLRFTHRSLAPGLKVRSYGDSAEEEFDGADGLPVEPVLPWGTGPDEVVGPLLSGADPLFGWGCTPCELVGPE